MKLKSRFFVHRAPLGLALTLVLSPIPQIYAADGTWTTEGSSNWSDSSNWAGGIVADGADFTADFSTIDITAPRTVQLDTARTIGHLVFGDTAGLFTNPWILGNGGDSANILTLENGGGPSITTKSYASIDAVLNGTFGFIKEGSSVLELSGANLYSGITMVNSGGILVSNPGALGATGVGNGTIVAAGAYIRLGANVTGENLSISGSGIFNQGALFSDTNSAWGGNIIVAADAKIGSGRVTGNIDLGSNNLRIAGNISGSITGAGNIIADGWGSLSGTNSYTGTTSITSTGRLTIGKTFALYGGTEPSWTKENISVSSGGILALNVGGVDEFTVSKTASLLTNLSTNINQNGFQSGSMIGINTSNAAGDVTFNHVIADSTGTGAGSLGLYKGGAGRLVLNQANTYSGTTWINGGELLISGAGTLGNGATNLLMTGGSLNLGGTTQTVRSVSPFTVDYGVVGGYLIDGETNITNGSLIASDFYDLEGTVSANLGGTAGLYAGNWNMGGNTVRLTGTNTFSGNTYLSNQGSLVVASPNSLYNGDLSLWTSSRISVASSSYLGLEGLTASQAVQVFGNLSNSVDGQGLNAGSLIGFGLTSGNQTWNAPLTDTTGNTGGRIFMSINKDGGTLTLAQTGSFTGELWILGGDTKFGANNATGISLFETGGKVADLNGFSGTYKGGSPLWVNKNQSSPSTITLFVPLNDPDSNYGSFGVFGGDIGVNEELSGSIHLVKSGQGDAQFNGSINLSAKSISVNSGSLVFNGQTSHGYGSSLTTTVNNSAKLFVNGILDSSIEVLAGGLLGGHGDVSYGVTSVAAGGTVSPGGKISRESGLPGEDPSSFNTPIGSLKLGEIHFANNSTYAYQADSSPMLMGGADLLIVQGDLNIDSMVQLAFADVADTPASFSPGTIFSLINYVGTWNGGLFHRGTNALEEGEEFFMGQNYWVINYEKATGGLNFTEDYAVGGRFITLTATAIPEPSTAILAASASILLMRRRRAGLN